MNNKSAKENRQDKLNSCHNQSHNNKNSQLLALVKFLAHQAAEEDFKTLMMRTNLSDMDGEE